MGGLYVAATLQALVSIAVLSTLKVVASLQLPGRREVGRLCRSRGLRETRSHVCSVTAFLADAFRGSPRA